VFKCGHLILLNEGNQIESPGKNILEIRLKNNKHIY